MLETQETESIVSQETQQIAELRKLLKDRSKNTFLLGKVLSEIKSVYEKDETLFTFDGLERYGFQFWGQFCEDLGFAKSSADRAIRLHRKFIVELGTSIDFISGFNYTKLDIICEACTAENYTIWLQLCEDLKIEDLRAERDKFYNTGKLPGDQDQGESEISGSVTPETARDWIESFSLLNESVKQTFVSPQDKKFIKEVYEEVWDLFAEIIRRKARGTEQKKPSEKLLRMMESVVKKP